MRKYSLAVVFALGAASALAQTPSSTEATPYLPAGYDSGLKKNYVRTWEAAVPITDPNLLMAAGLREARQTTQYVDGLGRPLQTVVKQGALATGGSAVDLVSAVQYDEFGREVRKYLPFASLSNTGVFKTDPFQEQKSFYDAQLPGQEERWYYSRTHFEASPLNRVQESFAPGSSWVGTNADPVEGNRKSVKVKYWINTAADEVKLWTVSNSGTTGSFGSYTTSSTANYGAGELYKTVSEDEQGKQVVEFKDKEGRVVLKKVQLTASKEEGTGSGHGGWLCTYYLYDDLGQLRCVVQPRGVELMDPATTPGATWTLSQTLLEEQCFRYEYDERGRMTQKKVPGAAPVQMVYDKRDRLVMTQDGNLGTGTKKWLVTLYDELNRPIKTGLWTNDQDGAYHRGQAMASGSFTPYPFSAEPASGWELLTETHYDDYNNIPLASGLTGTLDETYYTATNFIKTYNVTPDYAQEVKSSPAVKGLVTWTRIKVLGTTSDYLYSVNIYDEKGRVIQVKSKNITGGVDILTTQYDFAGKVLRTHLRQQKGGAPSQEYQVLNKHSYDDLGRLTDIKKVLVANGTSYGEKTIAKNTYDALGQLKAKTLAPEYNGGSGLETLAYAYNIRGWLLGVNRDYAKSASDNAHYFGFDLGYDKTTLGALGSYTASQLTGNIAGTVWKSRSDNQVRRYDFSYDAVNRLTGAAFNQSEGAGSWSHSEVDYSVDNLSYDANGNIKTLNQKGWKITGSNYIDQLTYNYLPNSNKLLNVLDLSDDAQTKLGDFRTSSLHPASGSKTAATEDYSYDENGNMVKDLNKDLVTTSGAGGIEYNYLNLPSRITVKKDATSTKGTIEYSYDAAGVKLKKITKETLASPSYTGELTTTTTYMGGLVYESKVYAPLHPDRVGHGNYTDKLLFIAHEEGRIRWEGATTATCTPQGERFVYDYFIKDHLGNTRMVLTEQSEPICYLPATSEDSRQAEEKQLYDIVDTRRKTLAEANVPTSYSQFEAKVYETNGAVEGKRTGLGAVLKVMAGDQVLLSCESFYNKPVSGTTDNNYPAVSELLNALVNSTGVAAKEAVTPQQVYDYATNASSLSPFLQSTPPENTANAYLNWILFDEQLKYVSGGADPVNPGGGYKLHVPASITATKNGFLYVYVSNQSNYPVYFDNLNIRHTPSAIVEETHYYPFGLAMAGISSKAANRLDNKYRYNGKEQQSGELSDGSGLEWYDYGARMYDAQVGRWGAVDPLADKFYYQSLYVAMDNNPINIVDPTGTSGTSTHTDKDGNVLAVYDDKDLGVYKHDDAKAKADIDKNHSEKNTSAGGTKMGETPYWDEFLASHPDPVTGQREPTSSGGVTYKINFGSSWDAALKERMEAAKGMMPWTVAEQSRNGGTLSLQDQPELTAQGRLFNGKYTSTESMGNYLAGYNAAQAGMPTYGGFQRIAGAYELQTHGHPEIQLTKWEMVKLALGWKHYGTAPLYGEVIQQYRWSRGGWDKYTSEHPYVPHGGF